MKPTLSPTCGPEGGGGGGGAAGTDGGGGVKVADSPLPGACSASGVDLAWTAVSGSAGEKGASRVGGGVGGGAVTRMIFSGSAGGGAAVATTGLPPVNCVSRY